VIATDSNDKFWLWRKWGRVATDVGGNKLEECDSAAEAIEKFEELFEKQTGNDWNETGPRSKRANFKKQPGKMMPIDVQYTDDDPASKKLKTGLSTSGSKLDPRVQDLVSNHRHTKIVQMCVHFAGYLSFAYQHYRFDSSST
jgi:predicted DNA-binding WGR domain protein